MKIAYNNKNRVMETMEVRKIQIKLKGDIAYEISVNTFGEMVVQKQNFGQGEGSILLKPSVSNEIRLS